MNVNLENIPNKTKNIIRIISELAGNSGVKIYAVGGFVRDLILDVDNFDIDIVVEGDAIKLAEILARHFNATIKKYKQFGTAVISFDEGFKIDFATARKELYEYPGAMPDVQPSTIKDDLGRRDFTVNAMAISLNKEDFGSILDFFGGKKDLENKIIRVLHKLSFIDDPTRIFRAIRFEQRFGFKIDEKSQNLLKEAVKLDLIKKINGFRIQDEILLVLNENEPFKAIRRLSELNCLKYVNPKIIVTKKMEKGFLKMQNVFTTDALVLGEKFLKWISYFLVLTDDLNLNEIKKLCVELKFTIGIMEIIIFSKQKSQKAFSFLNSNIFLSNSRIYTKLHCFPNETLLFLISKAESSKVKNIIVNYLTVLSKIKPILTGSDLKTLGFLPGPVFKKILSSLLEAKLNGVLSTKEDELRYVSKFFIGKSTK